MKTHISLILLLLSFLLLLLNSSSADEPPIKLGLIASLTGPAAEQGKNWLEGARLAAVHLNAEGISTKLIIEDDSTNPGKLASAFHKMAAVDRVNGIVGGTWDLLAEAAFPLAKQYKLPFVTPTNPVEILSDAAKNNPWAMTNGMSLKAEEEAIRRFLSIKKPKSVAFVYINVPFGSSHAELMSSLASELGISVVGESQLTFEGFGESIRQAALKVTQSKPELVYLITDYNGIDLFTRELSRLRTKVRILTSQHLDAAFTFSKDPSRYENAFGIYPKYKKDPFERQFKEQFGHAPKVYAAAGYDAVMFLVRAIEAKVDFSKKDALFSYPGLTGLHKLPAIDSALVQTRAQIMTTRRGVFEESCD